MGQPSLLIWGPRYGVDSWTNSLEDQFRNIHGWQVHRTPRYPGDPERELAETRELAQAVGAQALLANYVAWVGGPPLAHLAAYREAGLLTVAISHDEPYRWDGYDDRAARQAPGYDLWFTNWNAPEHLARHTAGRVVYSPCAARPEFYPQPGRRDIPVGFFGVYYPPRDPYLEAVADLGLQAYMIPRTEPPFHPWPPPPAIAACLPSTARYLPPAGVADFCRRSQISLDISEQPDGRVRSPKNRLFECVAAGSFTLAGDCPQIRELFTDGEHVVLYQDAADLREKARYYLAHPEAREPIAKAGAAWAAQRHQWAHRVAQMSHEIYTDLERRDARYRASVGVVLPTRNRGGLFTRAVLTAYGMPIVVVNTGTEVLPPGPYREVQAPGAEPSLARNIGVDCLPWQCEWLKFLDDDDCLRVGWRDAMLAVATGADVVVGGAISTDSRDPGYLPPERPYTSQIMVRRDAFQKVGGFAPQVRVGEERDLLQRLAAAGCRIASTAFPVAYKGGEEERQRPIYWRGRGEAQPPPRPRNARHARF